MGGVMAEERPRATPAIELPAPTHWPLVAALGVAMLFAGLVTSFLVSVVGVILAFRGAIGWWYEVLPEQQVEWVAALAPPQPVRPSRRTVEQLVAGVGGHRVRIPAEIHPYSAGISGGIAGGVAMALIAEVYGLVATGSLWYPINLLAAAAVPSLANASAGQLMTFNSTGLAVATLMHVVISLFVGLLYAVALPMFPRHPAIWGGLLAPLMWSGLLWTALNIINPALNQRINWVWFVASQIAFGLVAGFVVHESEKIATMQTWPLAARVGIEAPGLKAEREP
jgi:hypothetical protein